MKRRFTKQRQAVLACLISAKAHLTADELLLLVQQMLPSVNAATLYRNLHILEEEALVSRVSVRGTTFFEVSEDDHSHFFCLSCNALRSIRPDAVGIPSTQSVRAEGGFTVLGVSVLVEGVCSTCSGKPTPRHACGTCPSLCQNVIADRRLQAVPCDR